MPSATDELRSKMEGYFGDSVDDKGPIQFLRNEGFFLNRDYTWTPPEGKNWGNLTEKERDSIEFLFQEWDFAGLRER